MRSKPLIVSVTTLLVVVFTPPLVGAMDGGTRRSNHQARLGEARGCPASRVHYERFRGPGPAVKTLPWVLAEPHAIGLVGHLFYYDAHNPWARRHMSGWRIYTGGKSPDKRINMKILWTAPPPISDARSLVVRGTRIVRPSHFSQVLDVGPSILNVPRPGCWHLTLQAGRAVTSLTVLAVRPTPNSVG
jgi:hypothetical protein